MDLDQAAPGPQNDLIKDTDIKGFGDDVIKASMERPIIVDFWADWCGPCKQLMPVLEDAVQKAGGAVALVKVNADQNQALCGQLQVQSLPTVLAFWQGQPIDGFQGAVPPSQVSAFIERLVQQSGGASQNPIDAALEQVDAMFEAGEFYRVVEGCQQILGHEAGHAGTILRLADALLQMEELEQAKNAIASVDPSAFEKPEDKARFEKITAAIDLAAQAEDAGDIDELLGVIESDGSNYQARFDLALAYQAKGDMDASAEALLGIIMRDREWNEDAARIQLLKLFEAKGASDPFTLKYRRRLSSVLFS